MQDHATHGCVPIEETSSEYRAAAEALGTVLAGCETRMLSIPNGFDRRRVRLPDEYWWELQRTIAAFTSISRADGEYPEQMLIRLKDITSTEAASLEHDSPLRDAIIRLSIEFYFEH